jgi:hypothetical protein
LFHDFHQDWTIELRRSLNAGRLPPGYVALTDQQVGGPIPDVLTLNRGPRGRGKREPAGGVAIAAAPPKARFIVESEGDVYARRANRIRIQHRHGEVVAVIEIVSPGNKGSQAALRAFVRKTADLLWQGIHLLVVDLFPKSERDPQGIHPAIWNEVEETPFALPRDKPLTAVAYRASPMKMAYVEPVAVGDPLPSLPIFLTDFDYVPAPLEETYQASWAAFPAELKDLLADRVARRMPRRRERGKRRPN